MFASIAPCPNRSRFALWIPPALFLALTLLFSCNDGEEQSPFAAVLSSPPFSELTDSIREQPKNDDLYFRRAVLLNKEKFVEPALSDFQKAWSLSKQERYAYAITNIWLEKKPDSAVIFLNEALKELPQSYLLQLSLARAYDSQNKTDEALRVCNNLLASYPDFTEAWLLQSEIYQKKGMPEQSTAAMEKAYSLTPGNFGLAFSLAYQYAESRNPRTVTFCDSLISRDSTGQYSEPYYIKGIYYSNINDHKRAVQFFNETIKRDYNNLNAHLEKGKIFFEEKKYGEAYKVFQLINTIKPSFPDAYYWMGRCEEATGKKEDALLNYEKAFGLDRTFIDAKEAIDRLKKR